MAQTTVFNVANYFLRLDYADSASDGISNLKIQKLVYYAYGFYAALNDGAKLFDEGFEAWAHGPVVPDLYHKYKDYGRNLVPFDPDSIVDFTASQEELIEDVYRELGQFSAWRLRDMTHAESPWLDNRDTENGVISHEDIYNYFLTRVN